MGGGVVGTGGMVGSNEGGGVVGTGGVGLGLVADW